MAEEKKTKPTKEQGESPKNQPQKEGEKTIPNNAVGVVE